jgi:hypothetical protein
MMQRTGDRSDSGVAPGLAASSGPSCSSAGDAAAVTAGGISGALSAVPVVAFG